MKTKDAHELLLSLSRVPGEFYRDTVLLLETLDKIRNGKMNLPMDYCPFCCVTHVTCECVLEGETEKQYWKRMQRLEDSRVKIGLKSVESVKK